METETEFKSLAERVSQIIPPCAHGETKETFKPRSQLTDEEWIQREKDYIARQVKFYNEQEREPFDDIDCPICHNKTTIAVASKDGLEMLTKFCQCRKKHQIMANARRAGLGSMLGKKMEDYRAELPFQKNVKGHMKAYMENPRGWFTICGEPGSGKTLACMIVANDLLRKGKVVRYISWPELVREVGVDWFKDRNSLDEFKEVEVLYIDDFLKVANNDRALQIAYEILNYRYNHQSLTLLSGERTWQELMNTDSAIGSRIVEMSGENFIDLGHDPYKNQRMRGRTA